MNYLTNRGRRGNVNPFYNSFIGDFDRMFEQSRGLDNAFMEKETHYLATVDMPGVSSDDVEISIHDNMLKIEASRETETGSRNYSSSFFIPNNVNHDEDIKAIYEDGVLKVAIPKESSDKKAKKISLSEKDEDGFFKNLFSKNDKKEIDVKDKTH